MENSTKTETKSCLLFCELFHQCFRKMSFITFGTSQISLCQVNEKKIKSICDKEGFLENQMMEKKKKNLSLN